MKRAARQKAESGRPKWRKAFGYVPDTRSKELDDGTREIDAAQQRLVADAYEAVVRGEKITRIALAWNEAAVYGITGKPWSASTVSLFLRAPRNAGLRAHNDEIVLGKDGQPVKGTWPGLVDESLWRAAQTVMNAPGRAPGPKSVRKHRLTGVMRCGKPGCDGRLAGNWQMQRTGGKPGRPKAGEVKQPRGWATRNLVYRCTTCLGCTVRAEHVDPMLVETIIGRLARPDAAELLRNKTFDGAEAEQLRTDEAVLLARMDAIALERAEDLLTGRQAKVASDAIQAKLDVIAARQQDQERLRVFDGITLGTAEVAAEVQRLSPDRLRAVIDLMMTVTVVPVGKGNKVFRPERIKVEWL
ncbi:MAG: recombinase family protein [Mycobacterium sp.]|uniref:recombinase family protein n=1 Tax=Mycobacterium sp. TaxID=1785 RepID=UPI003C5718F2